MFIEHRQFIDLRYLLLDLLTKMPIKLPLMFFLVFLALDLMVVESTHFHAISVHVCFDFLILNMILDDVLQG